MANPTCPCTSGLRLHLCCGPCLKNDQEAPDAEALMRSRFAAFATVDTAYLWKTLHPGHPDRQRDESEVRAELAQSARLHRFRQLTLLDRHLGEHDEASYVLFHAKVFNKGRDVSFIEASTFRHDATGWRYLNGETKDVQAGWEKLRLVDFKR